MLTTTRWLGGLALLLALAGALIAAVTIEVDEEGGVTVTAPAGAVQLVEVSEQRASEPASPETPEPTTTGFTVWPRHPEAYAIHVAADGDDKSLGATEETPVRTLRRALQLVRHGSGDQILLRAGDTFAGGFGEYTFVKSGRDADHPLLVGVYGDGPRPRIETDGTGLLSAPPQATVRNIALQGLHVIAVRRLPGSGRFDADDIPYSEKAVHWLAAGERVHVEDCVFEGFNFNLVFQSPGADRLRGVTLRRSIVVDAWSHWDGAKGGHSSGVYADHVTGLRVEQCHFDHNGWIEGVHGGGRTKFNHNLYIQRTCRDVAVVDSVIARGASHGLQLRPGGGVRGNLFARNAMAVFVARSPSVVADNVVAESDDLSDRADGARGYGIETLPAPEVSITGNLLLDKRGSADWGPAIGLTYPRDWSEPVERYDVSITNNTVVRWPRNRGERSITNWTGKATVVADTGNVLDRASGGDREPGFVSGAMTLDDASGGDFEAWLDRARARSRGVWDPSLTAHAINQRLFAAYRLR